MSKTKIGQIEREPGIFFDVLEADMGPDSGHRKERWCEFAHATPEGQARLDQEAAIRAERERITQERAQAKCVRIQKEIDACGCSKAHAEHIRTVHRTDDEEPEN